jgi:prepilin signal peptidase PulO-like enzyme (type II secretory pathway)
MIGICGIAITFNQLSIDNETISLSSLFTKENAIALVIYICLGVVAVLMLMGDSGFQTIKNCG